MDEYAYNHFCSGTYFLWAFSQLIRTEVCEASGPE